MCGTDVAYHATRKQRRSEQTGRRTRASNVSSCKMSVTDVASDVSPYAMSGHRIMIIARFQH
eukprot:3941821-Rhodomonas_salina.8